MESIKSETIAADILGALGNETRLRVFRLLVRAGRGGMTVGQIQVHTATAPSTLAHHLQALANADLVTQEKQGRAVICTANFDTMDGIVAYLTDQCCQGVP